MQIQVQHVFRGKRGLGKGGDKQFIHKRTTLHANRWGDGCGRMGGYDQTHTRPSWSERDFWAIVKGAVRPQFFSLIVQLCNLVAHPVGQASKPTMRSPTLTPV